MPYSTHLTAASRTVIRVWINDSDPLLTKTSRGTSTSFHSVLLIGSPHWERTSDRSRKPWRTWGWSSELNASTTAFIISEETETQSGLKDDSLDPTTSLPLAMFDDVRKFRICTKSWLAIQATNRLLSFCSWRMTLMSPVDTTEFIITLKAWKVQQYFFILSSCFKPKIIQKQDILFIFVY